MENATTPLRPRPSHRLRPAALSRGDLDHPTLGTVLKLIWNTVHYLFHSPPGMIIGSAFVVLMLWGYHGQVDLLHQLWRGWMPGAADPMSRPPILRGVPWDQEFLSFLIGVAVVVGIPCLLIVGVYKQKLSDYGLGLPRRGRWRLTLISTALLFGGSAVPFYFAARDPGMQSTYPIYRGPFAGAGDFLLYELGYFAFFVVIEFIFRGYLLFGLFHATDQESAVGGSGPQGVPGRLLFGYYAILISMLSYTAWHLGKPVLELWSTLVWGLAAGTVALATETIWPIILVHWLLNVGLDFLLWHAR